MRFQHVTLATSVAAITAISAIAFATTTNPVSSLLTANQAKMHELALSLHDDATIKASKQAAIDRFTNAAPVKLPDGKATLGAAIDELVNGVVLSAADNDPANPKVIWSEHLPYTYGTSSTPGTRYGGDGTDRIYRSIGASPAHSYEIKVKRNAVYPSLDYSFEAIPLPGLWGQAKAALQSKDIDVAKDGSFTITADATPANGRRNHLQLSEGTATILVRDTLSDWSHQLPNQVTVTRIDNVKVAARSRDAIVKDAAAQIDATVDKTLKFLDSEVWSKPANELKAFERTLSWGVPGGVLAINRFSLKDDEALVITLDPITAKYLSIEVTDPWLRSTVYSNRSTSFNNAQAKPNADGSFTYVLSLKDAGAQNWLDSGDLHDGILVVRWEKLTTKAATDKAVREVRKVKLSEIASALPAGNKTVSPAERKAILAAREASYNLRLTGL